MSDWGAPGPDPAFFGLASIKTIKKICSHIQQQATSLLFVYVLALDFWLNTVIIAYENNYSQN